MIVDPVFKSRDTRVDEKVAFLIMPFNKQWSVGVAQVVREVLARYEFTVIRADEMHGENVVEDIWSAMLKCKFFVAEVTGKNPNVYYELGIAHAIGKRGVLLTQQIEDMPFDTRHLRHVEYSNDITGFEKIRKGIEGFVESVRTG